MRPKKISEIKIIILKSAVQKKVTTRSEARPPKKRQPCASRVRGVFFLGVLFFGSFLFDKKKK